MITVTIPVPPARIVGGTTEERLLFGKALELHCGGPIVFVDAAPGGDFYRVLAHMHAMQAPIAQKMYEGADSMWGNP